MVTPVAAWASAITNIVQDVLTLVASILASPVRKIIYRIASCAFAYVVSKAADTFFLALGAGASTFYWGVVWRTGLEAFSQEEEVRSLA